MRKQKAGGTLIAQIHQLSGRIFSRILKKYKISEINPAQGRILFVLWEQDEIPISELSKKTRLEKSTLTSMLDRLENEGFIKRTTSKKDRRKIFIKKTNKTQLLQDIYYKVSEEMTAIFYKGFSERQITDFEDNLEKILNNLIGFKE